jgi:hypothetical protein
LIEVKAEEHFVHAGEVLSPNHPVVKARPELFKTEVVTPKSTRRVGEADRATLTGPRRVPLLSSVRSATLPGAGRLGDLSGRYPAWRERGIHGTHLRQ